MQPTSGNSTVLDRLRRRGAGMTLLELLIALGISSIVTSAAITLAFAIQRASNQGYQRTYLYQATRAVIEVIRDDLYHAGLGTSRDAAATDIPAELRDPFSEFLTNNGRNDFLQFRSGLGVAAIIDQPADINLTQGQTIGVPVTSPALFAPYVSRNPNLGLNVFTRDGNLMARGRLTGARAPNVIDIVLDWVRPVANTSLTGFGVVTMDPPYVTYTVDQGTLYRCETTTAFSGPACPVTATVREALVDGVDAFQVGYVISGQVGVNTGIDLSGTSQAAVNNRRLVRGVQVWVLLRSPADDLSAPDTRSYTVGNYTFRAATDAPGTELRQRKLLTALFKLPNLPDQSPETITTGGGT